MAKRKISPLIRDKEGKPEMLNENEARISVAEVNRTRMRLLHRLKKLQVFRREKSGEYVDHARKTDHPIIQMIFKFRNELDTIPEGTNDARLLTLRVTTLSKIADLTNQITSEANKSSIEIQGMLARAEDMRQRKAEHQDKMEIFRNKALGQNLEVTDAELQMLAEQEEAAGKIEAPK